MNKHISLLVEKKMCCWFSCTFSKLMSKKCAVFENFLLKPMCLITRGVSSLAFILLFCIAVFCSLALLMQGFVCGTRVVFCTLTSDRLVTVLLPKYFFKKNPNTQHPQKARENKGTTMLKGKSVAPFSSRCISHTAAAVSTPQTRANIDLRQQQLTNRP